MTSAILSILIGYLLGSLSPAALLSKLKKENLRQQGTGNLGATNTMLVLGKSYGFLVMLFDVLKAFAAVKIARLLFPALAVAGMLAGSATVVGHVFPFYLKFKGGKGLAAFVGLVLGVDPLLCVLLFLLALTLILIINYGVAMPITMAILFPFLYGLRSGSAEAFLIAAATSVLLICVHFGNIGKARRGEGLKVREYIKNDLLHRA